MPAAKNSSAEASDLGADAFDVKSESAAFEKAAKANKINNPYIRIIISLIRPKC